MGSVLAVVAIVAVLRAPSFTSDLLNVDEAYLALQAQTLVDGGRLYVDVADRKPPVAVLIYAAVFSLQGSSDLLGVHLLAALWVAVTALLVGVLARRRYGSREGLWAAVLYALCSSALLPSQSLAASFELWALLPWCAAMVLVERGRPGACVAAGALLALTVLCKQTAMVALLPVPFLLLHAAPRPLRAALATAAGFVVTSAVVVASFGAEELFLWVFGGTGGYVACPPGELLGALGRGLGATAAVAAATGAVVWLGAGAARRAEREDLWLWVWLVAAGLSACLGLRFFFHYFLFLFPPACILASRPAAALAPGAARRVLAWAAAPALLMTIYAPCPGRVDASSDHSRLVARVRALSPPDERILVWGHAPEIYLLADRRPAMRFVHPGFLTGSSAGRTPGAAAAGVPGADAMLAEDLAAHPPRLVIAMPTYTAVYPLARCARLAELVARDYRAIATVDGAVIYAARR